MNFSHVLTMVVLTCLFSSAAALAGPTDGFIVEAVQVVHGGAGADVPTIAFVSEGYDPDDLPAFAEQVDLFVSALLASEPYATCRPIHVWRVDVVSAESGVDDPLDCPEGLGLLVNTYFDASLCGDGLTHDLLEYDHGGVTAVLDTHVPGWGHGVLLVNSDSFGRADGVPLATTTADGWVEDLLPGLLPENQPPICDAGGPYEAECAGEETGVTLSAAASSDPDCDSLTFEWSGPFSEGTATGETVTLSFSGLGTHPVQLSASDGELVADCHTTVTIVDTTPPDLSVMLQPNTLWPPNHKYRNVTAEILVQDTCDADVQVRLVSVTSSEMDDDRGDGNTRNDVAEAEYGTDDRSLKLRAERSGRGKGRVYSIRYEAEDSSGNFSEVEAFVVVPKNQGVKGFPCLPEAPEPVLPEQEGEDDLLHYRWEAEPCATWYQLWINRDDQPWHHRWYKKGHGAGFIHELLADHAPGRYDWWVRAWGPAGMGPWAAGPSFTLHHASETDSFAADDVILSGADADSAVASWYQFWITREGKPFWKTWVSAEEVVFEGGAWVYGVPYTFPLGQYAWRYRTWSRDGGMSRWDIGGAFDIGQLEVSAPNGGIQGHDVTVAWQDARNSGAEWYQLWLARDGHEVWNRWLPSTQTGSTGSEHAVAVPVELIPGSYTVHVRGFLKGALGPWSAGHGFEVEP